MNAPGLADSASVHAPVCAGNDGDVFADYAVGDVEQADVGHHARFLAVDVYPLVFVEDLGNNSFYRTLN